MSSNILQVFLIKLKGALYFGIPLFTFLCCIQSCDLTSEITPPEVSVVDPFPIHVDGLAKSFYLGVNTSGGLTDWITAGNGVVRMAYPSGQSWGVVFITTGEPKDPPRPGIDLSMYNRLSIELRGHQGSESVWIGIKDNTDPDDGSEVQVLVSNLTKNWETYELPLSQFYTADLQRLYVLVEFVFENQPATVYFRDIYYLP